jgi:hypothetical protein
VDFGRPDKRRIVWHQSRGWSPVGSIDSAIPRVVMVPAVVSRAKAGPKTYDASGSPALLGQTRRHATRETKQRSNGRKIV